MGREKSHVPYGTLRLYGNQAKINQVGFKLLMALTSNKVLPYENDIAKFSVFSSRENEFKTSDDVSPLGMHNGGFC